MDDKDRQLITDILKTGGDIAQKGFIKLVHYQFMDGLTSIVICSALLVFCAYLFKWLWRWDPDDSDAYFPRGIGFVVLSVVMFVTLCLMQGAMLQMLAPEGAAIAYILAHH